MLRQHQNRFSSDSASVFIMDSEWSKKHGVEHALSPRNPKKVYSDSAMNGVLSDKCHPVSVCRKFQEFMQHRVAATQQEQLHVEP